MNSKHFVSSSGMETRCGLLPWAGRISRDHQGFLILGMPRSVIRVIFRARIAEAEREGWLGEVEGFRVSLAGAEDKLAHMDRRASGGTAIDLGMPRIAPAQITQVEEMASLTQSLDDQQ
ncbi:hypothetical protein ACGF5T_34390 [Streptomyces sp. NPDC047853]|uniref:hypothetical protein n=1 Tax=unclassified Streptomyces TaxID=2593676 RepID=UPI003454F95C